MKIVNFFPYWRKGIMNRTTTATARCGMPAQLYQGERVRMFCGRKLERSTEIGEAVITYIAEIKITMLAKDRAMHPVWTPKNGVIPPAPEELWRVCGYDSPDAMFEWFWKNPKAKTTGHKVKVWQGMLIGWEDFETTAEAEARRQANKHRPEGHIPEDFTS